MTAGGTILRDIHCIVEREIHRRRIIGIDLQDQAELLFLGGAACGRPEMPPSTKDPLVPVPYLGSDAGHHQRRACRRAPSERRSPRQQADAGNSSPQAPRLTWLNSRIRKSAAEVEI